MKTYFREEQKNIHAFIWIIMIFVTILALYAKYKTFFLKQVFGNMPPTDNLFHFSDIIIIVILALLATLNLTVEIREDGIHYRYFPFHIKFRHISWTEVKDMAVRKYSPLNEYWGWGIRHGISGKAYNMKGNKGLQLVLKNGKRILFGTQHPEELKSIIEQIKHKVLN